MVAYQAIALVISLFQFLQLVPTYTSLFFVKDWVWTGIEHDPAGTA
jgi:hypothetical protein